MALKATIFKADLNVADIERKAPVKEDTATISATGPATSEFHISKPDGWPVGAYQVDITMDGKPAGTKAFKVQ